MIIPTDSTGLHFSTSGASSFTFQGNPSHPHEAFEYNGEVFVPDLGANMVWRLKASSSGQYSVVGSIPQPSGSGPRHMQIYGGTLFVLHELASTLTAQPLPASDSGSSTISSTVSIVPPNPPSGAAMAAAELLLPPPNSAFPTPYLYASNRNTGTLDSRGDAITILQFNNATQALSVVSYVYTGLDQIRGMQIGGPNNEYLIAGSYAGGAGVAVFQRTNGGANLTLIARDSTVGTRTSFVWV
jgi:6-phosphogluconolactonase (cycloisomerase 2 family)